MDTTEHLMSDTVSFSFDVADAEVMPESEVVSSEEEETGIISQLMDIREPLLKLRIILEQKLDVDLSQYDFWLQDTQLLEENMTLVEQCVQGEGLVQINVELKVESAGVKKVSDTQSHRYLRLEFRLFWCCHQNLTSRPTFAKNKTIVWLT